MGFYEKYIETVTKNDVRTRNSVDAIIGRMDELLDDRPDGRLSGLVVGRVQPGIGGDRHVGRRRRRHLVRDGGELGR